MRLTGTVWQKIRTSEAGLGGTVVLGVAMTAASGGALAGYVPKSYQVRLRTEGTPLAAYVSGQETLVF